MKHWKWNAEQEEWHSNDGCAALDKDGYLSGDMCLDLEETDELLILLQRRKDGRLAPAPTLKQVRKWLSANWWTPRGGQGGVEYWGPVKGPSAARVVVGVGHDVAASVAAISLIVGRNVESEVLACSE